MKLSRSNQRALENVQQEGACNWLTTLPLPWLGYVLNKQEFQDIIALRYNWQIDNIPKHCGCGSPNDIDHYLTCKLGGYRYVIVRHDQVSDTIADVMMFNWNHN